MSKLLRVIAKNIVLLLRSRSTAFVIIFGPFFIILLLGLAFTTPSSTELVVGYNAAEHTTLTDRYIENMQSQGFIVEEFPTVQECIERMKLGSLQTCIAFPKDFFVSDNKTNEIVFYVDESRTNFMHQIIDSISSSLGVESAELSKDLTNEILGVLWTTEEGIDQALGDIITLKARTETADEKADEAINKAKSMNLSGGSIDTDDLDDSLEVLVSIIDDMKSASKDIEASGRTLILAVNGTAVDTFEEALDEFGDTITSLEEDTDTAQDAFSAALDDVEDALDEVSEQFVDADVRRDDTVALIQDVQSSIGKARNDLESLKTHLEGLNENIANLKVTSSDTISKPIVTRIEYLTTSKSKLSFMFPYLLMLVVLFIGLLLSGTLVVMEKRSKSAFRTFCTPTGESVFIIGHFLTSLLILVVQLSILLTIAYYFIGSSLFANVKVALVLLGLGVVFFILLGMAIGYIINNQEAVTMISISLASVFLFLSNLILPLETLSDQMRILTAYNPYVLTSEALRKSMLFGSSFGQLSSEIGILILYSVIVLALLIIARNVMQSRFYLHIGLGRHRHVLEDPRDMYLKLEHAEIKNLEGLLMWLEAVDEKTFEKELPWKTLRQWLKKNRRQKWLRVRLAGKDRRGMIDILRKVVEKHK